MTVLRQSARLALASQSAKATAATTNFISGIMLASRLGQPDWQEQGADAVQHHGIDRVTAAHGTPIRTSYTLPFMGRQYLYPNMLGYVLMGLGFGVSTTTDTPEAGAEQHTLTLAGVASLPWISVMHKLGSYERKAFDGRMTRARFAQSRNGVELTFEGMCLREAEAAGTETVTAEADAPMIPAGGTFTVTSSDLTVNTLGEPRSHEMTIENPLNTDEQHQEQLYLADLPPEGLRATGTLTGLRFSGNIYEEFVNGGTSGTEPVVEIPEAQLVWKWQSAGYITGTTPYSVEFTIPNCQMMMRLADVEGSGVYVYDAQYRMLDKASGTEPMTVVLTNDTADYSGS